MEQSNQGRRKVKLSLKCLPALFCFLWIVVMCGSHAAAQMQGAPPPAPPQQDAPPLVTPPPTDEPGAAPTPSRTPPAADAFATAERVKEALTKETFAYIPTNMLDPFVPFISPTEVAPQPRESEEEGELAPEQKKPLTPLQRMSIAEIERGLRAITWGEMGRRAVIEDSAGKGYIVSVGTQAGDRNGVVTEIFNDRLVIQQELWDKNARRMVPQNSVVKLKKDVKQQ